MVQLYPQQMVAQLEKNIAQVIVGKEQAIRLALIALICRGHVLIEDVPGVGKTTLASALARSLDCTFRRIQFTPDLMPSDVTGYTMVHFHTGETEFREGAVMSQIVLADEINRTSPKTQSALLEVMEEHQVTVDGVTHPLPQPFMVMATQNPGEFVGTYPLPEAQMDRFFLRISMGYPTLEQEEDILERYSAPTKPMDTLVPVCTAREVIAMQQQVEQVYSAPELRRYVALLARESRQDPSLQLGMSTRASIALLHAAQALALLSGRDYVIPEDVSDLLLPVISHRLVLTPDARMKGVSSDMVLTSILQRVEVPLQVRQ
ncbi:MAG: MoxR family ATPase [Clostridia bacterium]|nr:MoxR family ATPase [Clostridia bacterium]